MDMLSPERLKRIYSLTVTLLFLLSAFIMTSGCILNSSGNTIWKDAPDVNGNINKDGTVTYIDLEGGFYGIITHDGTKYYPLNLDENMKKDGLNVRFLAEKVDDAMTLQQWGTTIEIINIKEI